MKLIAARVGEIPYGQYKDVPKGGRARVRQIQAKYVVIEREDLRITDQDLRERVLPNFLREQP